MTHENVSFGLIGAAALILLASAAWRKYRRGKVDRQAMARRRVGARMVELERRQGGGPTA